MALPLVHTIFIITVRLTLAILCGLVGLAVYQTFFHPLSSVPGPRLAAVSNIWHAYHARNGRMLELATTLHRVYGGVVRVGPNEVWLNSKEAFSKVYSKWIALCPHYGVADMKRCNTWLSKI